MFLPAAKICNEISGLPRCIFPGCHVSDQTVLTLSIGRGEGISGKTTNVPDLTTWHNLQPWDRMCTETNKPKSYRSVTGKRMLRPWLLLAVNHSKQWWTPSFSCFERKKQDLKWNCTSRTAYSREGHGKLLQTSTWKLNSVHLYAVPKFDQNQFFTTFPIKMLQSGYQVSLIKTWPVCHCWQHRSQSHWHCWWHSEILSHNSS